MIAITIFMFTSNLSRRLQPRVLSQECAAALVRRLLNEDSSFVPNGFSGLEIPCGTGVRSGKNLQHRPRKAVAYELCDIALHTMMKKCADPRRHHGGDWPQPLYRAIFTE
ncbi:hypothetical protein [Fulvimarina sp. MAC3]|uniref:hypothetical protein n=1 Tax=Fulvimarina sp. MAC3 TaxID=3148887 RepID=UPI0031FCD06E